MSWGYGAMSIAPCLGYASLVMIVAGFLLPVAYPIGNRWGKRAAAWWFFGTLALAAVSVVALLVWGGATGQLERFVAIYGTSPIFEMGLFCIVWMGIFGFPTVRFLSEMRSPGL